ncbi:MAG: heavy-metal-associated domain-containing protein [Gemmatimonadota bacterium]
MKRTVKAIEIIGMRCPFCIGAVRERLEPIDGVEALEIDRESGVATLEVADEAHPSDEDVARAVEEAGFTAGAVRRGVGAEHAA